MALSELRDVQDGFAGGINTSADVYALQPNEFRVCQNGRLSLRGSVGKRGGTQIVSASAVGSGNTVRGGFSWRTASATQELAVANGLLHTGTLSIGMTWTARAGALSSSAVPSFASFRGPSSDGVYIADGGPLNFWDGTTFSVNIASTPSLDQVVGWGPRLFGIGSGNPETLYWSSTTSGTNGHTIGAAAGGGQAIVRTYGGQRLTALAPLRGSLLIFHVSAISRFTGMTTDDINISAGTQGITNDVGTIAPRSIIVVENAAYFLSDRGVFACSEAEVQPVASPIEQTLAALSQSDWSGVSAVHARGKNEIWFSIPSVGVYVYNYRTGGWAGPWDGAFASPSVTALWDTRDSAGRTVILAGCNDGNVLWCDKSGLWKDRVSSAGSGGSAYTFSVQMKRFFGGDFTQDKSWRDCYFLGTFPSSANTTVTFSVNNVDTDVSFPTLPESSTGLTWAPSVLWGSSGSRWGTVVADTVLSPRVPIGGVSAWVDVTLTDTANNDVQISQVMVKGFPRGRR